MLAQRVMICLYLFVSCVNFCWASEYPWFTGILENAQQYRRKLFDSNFKDAAASIKLDATAIANTGSLTGDARYFYCQQHLYVRLLAAHQKLTGVSVSPQSYPDWPEELLAARKAVFLPQMTLCKNKLKNRDGLIERSMEVKDIEDLQSKCSRSDFFLFLLLLPEDINLFAVGMYEEQAKTRNGGRSPGPNESGKSEHSSVGELAAARMDAHTADQVQAMAGKLKELEILRKDRKDVSSKLEEALTLAGRWPDNPLLAGYYRLLGDYWKTVSLESGAPGLEEKCHALQQKALMLYGESLCSEQIYLVVVSASGVHDFISLYAKLWAFQNDRGPAVYPVRDITDYFDRVPKDYPPARYSPQELLERIAFEKGAGNSLSIVEANVLMRIAAGTQVSLPAELRGSPLWMTLKQKGMLREKTELPVINRQTTKDMAADNNASKAGVPVTERSLPRDQTGRRWLLGLAMVIVGMILSVVIRQRRRRANG